MQQLSFGSVVIWEERTSSAFSCAKVRTVGQCGWDGAGLERQACRASCAKLVMHALQHTVLQNTPSVAGDAIYIQRLAATALRTAFLTHIGNPRPNPAAAFEAPRGGVGGAVVQRFRGFPPWPFWSVHPLLRRGCRTRLALDETLLTCSSNQRPWKKCRARFLAFSDLCNQCLAQLSHPNWPNHFHPTQLSRLGSRSGGLGEETPQLVH